MKKKIKIGCLFLFVSMAYALVACTNDDDVFLTFIGDSLVARWDLQEYFPSSLTENRGVSGSGISYIESCAGQLENHDIVVLVGTNDCSMMKRDMEGYADRYVKAVSALGGRRVYLFSILPRSSVELNSVIRQMNQLIKQRVTDIPGIVYLDAYNYMLREDVLDVNLSSDGVHVNNYGYDILSKLLNKALY